MQRDIRSSMRTRRVGLCTRQVKIRTTRSKGNGFEKRWKGFRVRSRSGQQTSGRVEAGGETNLNRARSVVWRLAHHQRRGGCRLHIARGCACMTQRAAVYMCAVCGRRLSSVREQDSRMDYLEDISRALGRGGCPVERRTGSNRTVFLLRRLRTSSPLALNR